MSPGSAPPWDVRGEAVVAATPFFRVRVEKCLVPDGPLLDYYLLDAPDWVNVLAVTQDLELMLVRQYRHAIRAATLEIPAGGCRPGETPLDAGIRELREETGHGGPARLIRSRSVNPALFTNNLHTVLVYPAVQVADLEQSALEHTSPEPAPPGKWLAPGFAAGLGHLYTALAVHELRGLLDPADPADRAAVRAALSRLTEHAAQRRTTK